MKNKRTAKIFGVVAGLVNTVGITWGAFKWGVYYAQNNPHPEVLSVEPENNLIITNEFVKVMKMHRIVLHLPYGMVDSYTLRIRRCINW